MAWSQLTTNTTTSGGSYFIIGGQGATLASADSITVTDSFHEVSGSTTINTINGGSAGMGLFLYRPVGASWAIGSSGNIDASSATPTARVVFLVTPDGTNWYGDSQGVSVASANTDITVAESGGTYTLTFNPANVTLDEFTGPLAISKGGSGQTTATAAFDALAPTTTTGDVIYFNGTDNVRLAVGASGTVLVGGTNPSYTASPTATTWGVGDANNGMVSLGSNNVGWKINSTNELDLDATRLAPVTNLGLGLGDANQFWARAYTEEGSGWRVATLSNTPGANTIATFPLSTTNIVSAKCEFMALAVGDSSNRCFRGASTNLAAYNNAGTMIVDASATGAIAGQTTAGTFNLSALTITLADAGSNVVNVVATTTVSAGTATSIILNYKLTFTYGDPTITEIL